MGVPCRPGNSARDHMGSADMSTKSEPTKVGYSIREACNASSLGRTSIYAHIASGRLRATRVGGRTIIPADSLHALITGETGV